MLFQQQLLIVVSIHNNFKKSLTMIVFSLKNVLYILKSENLTTSNLTSRDEKY